MPRRKTAMIDKYYYGQDACLYLARGVNDLADLIKKTYGPLGSNVVFGNQASVPVSVRSGNGIIQEINTGNPGTELAKEAIIKMAETEGDGTTTAVILLQKLMNGALFLTMSGMNPVRLRKAILAEAERVKAWIESRAHRITNIKAAARMASAGDDEIENLLCLAFEKVTAEGIVTVRDTMRRDSYVEIYDCLEIDQGYVSEEMITDPADLSSVLNYPYILLTDQVIKRSEDIAPAMNLARKAGKSLFVMAQDITGEALATLIVNIRNGKLQTVAVRATAYGERRKEILKDIAAVTGAEVVTADFGDSLQSVTLLQMGQAESVRTTGGHTCIYGGRGDSEMIGERIAGIRAEISASSYEVDRVNLRNRLARLNGGVAIIFAGAPTETEMRTRRQSIKSAVAAVRSILKHGAVEGGGIALYLAAEELYKDNKKDNRRLKEEYTAALLFKEMLTAPMEQLFLNLELPIELIKHIKSLPSGCGYDVLKKQYGNMFDMGIADSAGTLCHAVETAASLTGLIITAGAVVRNKGN